MSELFVNGARGRLSAGISAGATSLVLRSGQGALFPTFAGGDFAWLVLEQGTAIAPTAREIVQCTGRTGDTLTVIRAQQSTSGQAFVAGARVELRLTAQTLASLQQLAGFNRRLPMGGLHPEKTVTLDGYGAIGGGVQTTIVSRPTPTMAGTKRGLSAPRISIARMAAASVSGQTILGTAGLAPNIGGMELLLRFCIDTRGDPTFIGTSNQTSLTWLNAANPSTKTGDSFIGVGFQSAAANWSAYVNDGSGGTVTVASTGIPVVIGNLVQMRVWSPRGVPQWYVELIDFDAGSRYFANFVTSGGTTVPTCGQSMYPTSHAPTGSFSIVGGWTYTW